MKSRASTWLRVIAVFFAFAMIAAACGNDDDSGDTAKPAPAPATEAPAPETEPAPATEVPAPEPEATPEPPPLTEAPAPEPEATPEPPASLEGFVVGADTTGGELLEGVSDSEASCVRDEAGDSYPSIVETALVEGGSDPSFAEPMAACLTEDNFVVYSTALIAANAGATSDESRNCLTELGRTRPEFAYVTFGVEGKSATSFDPEQLRPFIGEFYNCFADAERVRLTVHTMDHIAATTPISGRDFLDAMGEDVINCYLEGLGMPREQFEILVETAFAAGTSSTTQGPDCLNIETIAEILVILASKMVGGLTDESAACIRAFGIDHPEFLELMALGDFDPESMTEEEFVQIAVPGLGVFDCFTISELLPVQALVIEMVT